MPKVSRGRLDFMATHVSGSGAGYGWGCGRSSGYGRGDGWGDKFGDCYMYGTGFVQFAKYKELQSE